MTISDSLCIQPLITICVNSTHLVIKKLKNMNTTIIIAADVIVMCLVSGSTGVYSVIMRDDRDPYLNGYTLPFFCMSDLGISRCITYPLRVLQV